MSGRFAKAATTLVFAVLVAACGGERCLSGLKLDSTGTCANVDECATRGSVLCPAANAQCVDLIPTREARAGYSCGCRSGFSDSAGTCVDTDECAVASTCGANAGAGSCQNVANGGGYNCTCNAGYRLTDSVTDPGLPKTCVDVRECDTSTTCGAGVGAGTCTNLAGSYSCQCNTGYAQPSGVGAPACADVNECATNNGGCNASNAVCSNSPGAYSCSCAPGYSGDGITSCADVNECVTNTDDCDPLAICTNIVGGFTCACSPGYSGSGKACADTNECMAGNPCNEDNGAAVCTNATGSYTCACNAGYAPMAPGGAQAACVDVDECAANNGGCAVGATCTNSTGGFSCACPATQVACNGTCVDLQTNVNHCGACNFPAVGGRTCVAGKPSPAWTAMSSTGAPTDARFSGFTGSGYVVFANAGVYRYDLDANAWTFKAMTYPFPSLTASTGTCFVSRTQGAALPRQGAFLITYDTDAYVYVDAPGGGAFDGPYGTSFGAPSARNSFNLVYDGTEVHLLFGALTCTNGASPEYNPFYRDGGSFDVATRSWRSIPAMTGTDCAGSYPRLFPYAVEANDVLVGVGRSNADNDPCVSTSAIRYDLLTRTWATNVELNSSFSTWIDPELVSVGPRALLFGDGTSNRSGAWLIDPRGGAVATTPPPSESAYRVYGWLAYTGRSILYWGGYNYSGGALVARAIGAAGTLSGDAIDWRVLPTSVLGGRGKGDAGEGSGGSNTQGAWTGRELIVYGGYDGSARYDGARYQPPVGCVCPRASNAPDTVPDVCSNVPTGSIVTATCTP